MKFIKSLILLLGCVFTYSSVIAQDEPNNPNAQRTKPHLTRNSTSEPGQAVVYTWNPASSAWEYQKDEAYQYTASGLRTAILTTANGVNVQKQEWSYNANNQNEQYTQLSWNGASWDTAYKSINAYDALGNFISNVEYYDSSGVLIKDYEVEYVNIFDSNSRIIEQVQNTWMSWTGIWETARTLFTYGASNNYETAIYQAWDGISWINTARYHELTWDANGQATNWTLQGYSTGSWQDTIKAVVTFDGFGGYVSTRQRWTGATWILDKRISSIYNDKCKRIESRFENWVNNAWLVYSQTILNRTYNANSEETQLITQVWNNTSGTVVNSLRYDYSAFQHFSSIAERSRQLSLRMFPNPASTTVTLLATGILENESGTATVQDMTGRVIATYNLRPGSNTLLDVSGFARGFYSITVHGKTSRQSAVIVLE